MNDYYAILGVAQDASAEEIKKAYRKRARQLHPDVAGPDKAEEFKDVQRAYDVLRDPERRRMYDLGGPDAAQGGGNPMGGGFGSFQDVFDAFFGAATGGGSARGPVPRQRRGRDAQVRLEVDLEDAVFGTTHELRVETAVACPTCDGTCCRPGTHPRTCSTCEGRGTVQRVTRSFLGQVMASSVCPTCQGHGTVIPEPCQECSGDGRVRARRTIEVAIPAGVSTGTQIRLAGEGEVGPAGGPAGDLFVEIHEAPHPTFIREGYDLHCTVRVPMTAAALGTTINLDTFDGPREISIDPGTQPADIVTLDGLGVGKLRQRQQRGDILVHVDVVTPTKLSDRERALLEELGSLRGDERGEVRSAQDSPGVFARLRDMFTGARASDR